MEYVVRKLRECYNETNGYEFTEPSLTQQQFKDESDINVLFERFQDTGFYYDPLTAVNGSKVAPRFDDFSNIDPSDYMHAQNILVNAREQFNALPAEIRERFNYDPALLLKFVSDEANYDEAVKLGIVIPKETSDDVKDSEVDDRQSVESNT